MLYIKGNDIIQDTEKQKRSTHDSTNLVDIQASLNLRDHRNKPDTINGNMPKSTL